jgi:hypothetical protein
MHSAGLPPWAVARTLHHANAWKQQLVSVFDACYSEYMSCPLCSGHIGWQDNRHDDFCPLLSMTPDYRAGEPLSPEETQG